MTRIVFVGAGGRVSTTALAQFARFKESEQCEFALYDPDMQAAEEAKMVFLRAAEMEGIRVQATIMPSLKDALKDARFVAYGAICPDSDKPPFNLKGELGNIDAMLDLVEQAREFCAPDCTIINFANPTDLLGMILRKRFPDADILTLCTGPEELKRNMMRLFGVPDSDEGRLVLRHVGGNHFGFVVSCTLDGRDVMSELRTMDFDWRNFDGLRHGDGYDLARVLSLYRASGILTQPSGHIAYYHGVEDNPGHSPDHGHFRPTKAYIVNTAMAAETSREHFWRIMDSWAARAVAVAVMSFLGHSDLEFALQMPNEGFLPGLPDDAFVESWGRVVDGRFERFPVEIPPLIQHLVIHNNWGNALMAEALAEEDYEKLCHAMMFRGDRTNFRYSIPSMRMVVADKWNLDDDLEDIYSRAILEKEPGLEFEFMDFEEKKLLVASDDYPWDALRRKQGA